MDKQKPYWRFLSPLFMRAWPCPRDSLDCVARGAQRWRFRNRLVRKPLMDCIARTDTHVTKLEMGQGFPVMCSQAGSDFGSAVKVE